MPAPVHAARISAIADLAGPIAHIDADTPIHAAWRPAWLEVLGHLRIMYAAETHALIRSALDGYLEGHALPGQCAPSQHMLRAATALVRIDRTDYAPSVDGLAYALAAIWATAPQGGPALATLAPILARRITGSAP